LLPRFLAVARDLVRTDFLRADTDLRPDLARVEAERVDVLRERVDFVPAFLPPRLVDFFVAAIGILSLLFAVCALSQRRTQCESGKVRGVVRKRCTFIFTRSPRRREMHFT
jgi:hypothetical protein